MLRLGFALVICILGFGGTMLMGPIWGLSAFSLFTHITPQQLSPEVILPLRLPLLLSLWVLGGYLFSSRYPRKFSKLPLELWLMLWMLLGMLAGVGNALNPYFVYNNVSTFGKYIVFFILFVNILDSREKIRFFLDAQIISAAWLVYRCWDLRGRFSGRFENVGGGVISDSNHFAAAVVLMFPIVVRRIFEGPTWIRVGAAIGAFGMVMTIIITGSRGGFLGLAVQTLAFFFFYKKYRKKIAIILICGAIAVAPFISDYYIQRVAGIFNKDEIEDVGSRSSVDSRLQSWSLAYEIWTQFPMTGCGMGNFRYYMGYHKEGLAWGELGHVAHSLWLQVLGEGGLAVTIPFLWILLLFYLKTFKVARYYKLMGQKTALGDIYAIQTGFSGFLVCATFLNRLFYEPIYWFSGIAVAYVYVIHRELLEKRLGKKKVDVRRRRR